VIGGAGEAAVVKGGVAFEVEALGVAALAIDMDAPAELVEEDVVADAFGALGVLGVNGMAVTAVGCGALPAVVVDQAAVDLGVSCGSPESDADAGIMDDQVDAPGVRAEDVHAATAGGGPVGGVLVTSKPQYHVHVPRMVRAAELVAGQSMVARSPGHWRTMIGLSGWPVSELVKGPG
jgi:hypothetical protein